MISRLPEAHTVVPIDSHLSISLDRFGTDYLDLDLIH